LISARNSWCDNTSKEEERINKIINAH